MRGDKRVHLVKLLAGDLPPLIVTVDAENGDVLGASQQQLLPQGKGSLPTEARFRDHRDLGGLASA